MYNIDMIDYEHLKLRKYHYLEGDETKIENYAEALADKSETWVCHHRRELEPDRNTIEDLKAKGLYWYRPPEELIFLTNSDHMRLHSSGQNNAMYGKSSWEKCTPEQRVDRAKRYSQSMRGKNKGKHMWNDGVRTVFAFECPEGFKYGMLRKKTNKHWWNNGKVQVFEAVCPEGFSKGKLKKKNE